MGVKAGVVIGLGIGYWFGAKAGQERYVQLEAMADRLRESQAYQSARDRARDKAGSAVTDGLARAKSIISDATSSDIDLTVEAPLFDQDRER